nr:hypothetical protein [Nanoarchaeum sp.]
MRTYKEILKSVSSFLNKNNISYMIVGAVSIAIYGEPRTSADIDIIIQLEGNVGKFVEFLRDNKFSITTNDVEEALKEKTHFSVFDNKSVYRLDIKDVYTEFDKQSFERRVKKRIDNLEIWVNSPEDAVLSKLMFGSEQDLNDARSILLRQRNLDMDYLGKMSKALKVSDKLSKLLEEIKEKGN